MDEDGLVLNVAPEQVSADSRADPPTTKIPVCRCLNNSIGVQFSITIPVLAEPFVDYPSGLNSY